MAKLVITLDGIPVRDFQLNVQRVSIGRKPGNAIRLDDATVSGEHAAILMGAPATITDLGSTNGTSVNGERIGKCELHHGDVVAIGRHRMKFVDEARQDLARTVMLKAGDPDEIGPAVLHVLSGPKAGQRLTLERERSAIGKPGAEVVVIAREARGYTLLPVRRGVDVRLNGIALGEKPAPLHDGDVLEVAGAMLQFRKEAC